MFRSERSECVQRISRSSLSLSLSRSLAVLFLVPSLVLILSLSSVCPFSSLCPLAVWHPLLVLCPVFQCYLLSVLCFLCPFAPFSPFSPLPLPLPPPFPLPPPHKDANVPRLLELVMLGSYPVHDRRKHITWISLIAEAAFTNMVVRIMTDKNCAETHINEMSR